MKMICHIQDGPEAGQVHTFRGPACSIQTVWARYRLDNFANLEGGDVEVDAYVTEDFKGDPTYETFAERLRLRQSHSVARA